MNNPPRISVVHAFRDSMPASEAAFRELWPQAQSVHLFDESLYVDHSDTDPADSDLRRRIASILAHGAASRADAILFTGSLFSAAVEAARDGLGIPILTAYEALVEDAFAAGRKLAVLATVERSLQLVCRDIERYAAARKLHYQLKAHHVAGALEALQSGFRGIHDNLIAAAALEIGPCDALLLAQFSMTTASPLLVQPRDQLFTAPASAVRKLRRILHAE